MILADLPQSEYADAQAMAFARNKLATDELLARLWYHHPKGDCLAGKRGKYVVEVEPEPVVEPPQQPEPLPPVQDQLLKLANDLIGCRGNDSMAPVGPTVREVQRVVCEFYGLPFVDMISKRRDKAVIRPRFVAIHLCRKHTQRSLPDIARLFGGRDHTSALAAIRRMKTWIESDSDVAAEVAEIEARLTA